MEQSQPGMAPEKRPDNDNRKPQTSEPATREAPAKPQQATMRQRWNATQLSKKTIFWICLAMIAGTMLVGFTWGGWVTGGAAQQAATSTANDAVVQRLTAICVANFQQDPDSVQKLADLKAASSYEQRDFVTEQGWATMPGDEQPDSKVVTACARWLAQYD
jgi:hypothetical protein